MYGRSPRGSRLNTPSSRFSIAGASAASITLEKNPPSPDAPPFSEPWGRSCVGPLRPWAPTCPLICCGNAPRRKIVVDPIPLAERLLHLCSVQAQAWTTLEQNLIVLGQPVVIQSVTGGDLEPLEISEDLQQGRKFIYQLKGASVDAKVLDLGGQDHTQNLISTINQLD